MYGLKSVENGRVAPVSRCVTVIILFASAPGLHVRNKTPGNKGKKRKYI